MSEHIQEQHEFKSPHRIQLNYHGIGSEVLRLDHEVTDRYMHIIDGRRDISIVQEAPPVYYDYLRKFSRKSNPSNPVDSSKKLKGNKYYSGELTNNGYVIRIQDQELCQRTQEGASTPENFDPQFTIEFAGILSVALKECLRHEKLLNAGNFNSDFMLHYVKTIIMDYLLLTSAFTVDAMFNNQYPDPRLIKATLLTLLMNATIHMGNNIPNLIKTQPEDKPLSEHEPMRTLQSVFIRSSKQDPFIRDLQRNPYDLIMPLVPMDKYVRGALYLRQHGKEFVHNVNENDHELDPAEKALP